MNLREYLIKLKQNFNNSGLILEHPNEPLEFIKDEKDGQIIGMEAYDFIIKFPDGHYLDYSEKGDIKYEQEITYKIESHKYQFIAKAQSFHPFRIDLDKHGPHAHQCDSSKVMYDSSSNLPYHLHFPDDIDLNIEDFDLALAINTSLMYIGSNRYPLKKGHANIYNESNERLRRQLKK